MRIKFNNKQSMDIKDAAVRILEVLPSGVFVCLLLCLSNIFGGLGADSQYFAFSNGGVLRFNQLRTQVR